MWICMRARRPTKISKRDSSSSRKKESVIGKIMEEMVSDGDDESDKLLNLYLESPPKERALLDCALIALCGWSLHTIIDMMTKPEDEGNIPKEGVHHANKGISD